MSRKIYLLEATLVLVVVVCAILRLAPEVV